MLASRDEYFAEWSRLHGGYDPRTSTLVRTWLGGTYVLARPLARARVAPDLVTVAGLLVATSVAAVASLGGGWAAVAAALTVLCGVLDGLDGAVAALTGRASRWGFVLDSVADRVGDVLFLVALALLGAPGWLCALGGALMFLQEYARARAGAAGMTEVAVVTVSERPTRVIVTAAFLLATAVVGDPWPTVGAAAWTGLGAVACLQLGVALWRRLR